MVFLVLFTFFFKANTMKVLLGPIYTIMSAMEHLHFFIKTLGGKRHTQGTPLVRQPIISYKRYLKISSRLLIKHEDV